MANALKVAMRESIVTLYERGWPQRRIARELGVDRETVGRYIRLHQGGQGPPDPSISTAGSPEGPAPKPAISTAGSTGRRSLCAEHQAFLEERLAQGLSAQRSWQDLVAATGFTGSYESVKRFARRLEAVHPLPFRRLECAPGDEAQVDFGRGAPVTGEGGRRRHPHLFRIVLSHSRKAYSEAVWRQTTEQFIRVLENAFRYFGGVPRTLVIDNLRAAVGLADWYDPELHPKIRDFCRHYGTVILPTRPRTPRHKGKIERAVGYAQDNSLKGRVFANLAAENAHLLHWEEQVADTRLHGTTRRQVRAAFEQERPALQTLPPDLFACFEEAERTVHRDGHVEVMKAYYSVPPEYTRRMVWARWDNRFVRIFNGRFTQIAAHARCEPGRFSTAAGHVPPEKINGIERGADWMLRRLRHVGPHTDAWARAMLGNRGIEGLRPLYGLLNLTERLRPRQLEEACRKALDAQQFSLRDIRKLAASSAEQPTFAFLDHHPLIRPVAEYGALVAFPTDDPSPFQSDVVTAGPEPGTGVAHSRPLGSDELLATHSRLLVRLWTTPESEPAHPPAEHAKEQR